MHYKINKKFDHKSSRPRETTTSAILENIDNFIRIIYIIFLMLPQKRKYGTFSQKTWEMSLAENNDLTTKSGSEETDNFVRIQNDRLLAGWALLRNKVFRNLPTDLKKEILRYIAEDYIVIDIFNIYEQLQIDLKYLLFTLLDKIEVKLVSVTCKDRILSNKDYSRIKHNKQITDKLEDIKFNFSANQSKETPCFAPMPFEAIVRQMNRATTIQQDKHNAYSKKKYKTMDNILGKLKTFVNANEKSPRLLNRIVFYLGKIWRSIGM
ncbi:hypothetical protein RFI_25298 [Reticulomyxa filosa]|uniref:Uncharacterized protein n=1 Tax=Reticulomyxa filosa TaxID=46433 RepID=X6MDI7_RETFI|nr:hypothetical protein RFI_25298 [Reticulomyxa filosa]|eukprot:ETO12083.1 hypothetical protein RFI_25298 [Reticulomyxa filosa]